MKTTTLGISLCFATFAQAFFRMQCSRLSLDRVDPLVYPGRVPSPYINTVSGGKKFSPSCTEQTLKQSTCTSCQVKGDNSVYWTPALYFQDGATGMFELVSQIGPMIVYYLPEREKALGTVYAFPNEFRMLVGDPSLRSFPAVPGSTEAYRRQAAIGFNCLNYASPPSGFLENHTFPNKQDMKKCKDGLRAEVAFPNCWDGRNSDSADHRSHVAYPADVQGGSCPSTHPNRLVSILYETTWNVALYNDRDGKFVWSNADPTGFGYTADFMTGWVDGLLERVMADPSCTTQSATGGLIQSCNTFQTENRIQSASQMQQCTISPFAQGNFKGPMSSLPGYPSTVNRPEHAGDIAADL